MPLTRDERLKLEDKAHQLRLLALDTVVWAGSGHIGGCRAQGNRFGPECGGRRELRIDRDQVAFDADGDAVSGKIDDGDVHFGRLAGKRSERRSQGFAGSVLLQIHLEAEPGECGCDVFGIVGRGGQCRRVAVVGISQDESNAPVCRFGRVAEEEERKRRNYSGDAGPQGYNSFLVTPERRRFHSRQVRRSMPSRR